MALEGQCHMTAINHMTYNITIDLKTVVLIKVLSIPHPVHISNIPFKKYNYKKINFSSVEMMRCL